MGFSYLLIKLITQSRWISMRVLAMVRGKMVAQKRRDPFEKYLSSVDDIVWKIPTAKKGREQIKEGTRIKAGCFLRSSPRHLLLFSFRHNGPTVSWVPWRHENCSAKIRYNHCRRARSETDSFRTSRESVPRGIPPAVRTSFFLLSLWRYFIVSSRERFAHDFFLECIPCEKFQLWCSG